MAMLMVDSLTWVRYEDHIWRVSSG